MKILVLGDPHFKKDNLHFMKWSCQEILEIIDREQPDLCVCLGDTLDTHERVTLRPLHMATKFFFAISDKCPLVVIIGNHDRENNNDFCTDIHPFIGMIRSPKITIVDDTYWDKENNFIYVPYVYPGRFIEALGRVGYHPGQEMENEKIGETNKEEVINESGEPITEPESITETEPEPITEPITEPETKLEPITEPETKLETKSEPEPHSNPITPPRLIFSHQEFKGSCINTGVNSSLGDRWSPEWPLVISGHIHEHQTLPQVVYVGTFIQQSYGESPDKALLMLHFDETQDNPTIQRIPLSSMFKRQTVDLGLKDLDNFMNYIPKNSVRSEDIKSAEDKMSGILVRVRLHVDATETKTLKTNPSYIALESAVDKVDVVPDSAKTSIAMTMIENLRSEGVDHITITLEQVVQELLKDDPLTLQLFQTEILA